MPNQYDKNQKIKHILSNSLDISTKLKKADPDIQEYVRALENKCTKLYSEYFKMKAENVALKRRVFDFEKNPHGNIIIGPEEHTEK